MKKILTICSTLDFQNYTRRATIEAIAQKAGRLDVVLYTGLKNRFTPKNLSPHLNTTIHHFWIPESLNRFPVLRSLETAVRKPFRKRAFAGYDVIFFTDPNQYRLLPYVGDQTVVYLIRDPNILQAEAHREGEKALLDQAGLVLATSRNLAESYLPKYYGFQHSNIQYWPNCADLELWKAEDKKPSQTKNSPVIGVAGNFSKKRTDYELLTAIAENLPEYRFEIAGMIDRDQNPVFWDSLLAKENIAYLGLLPLDELPETVAGWNVGLVTDRVDEYASYMHHNKVYQYLAMGVPVVSMRIHDDYELLKPCVESAKSHEEYTELIWTQADRQKAEIFRKSCRSLAVENSAEKRAEQFMDYIEERCE